MGMDMGREGVSMGVGGCRRSGNGCRRHGYACGWCGYNRDGRHGLQGPCHGTLMLVTTTPFRSVCIKEDLANDRIIE